MEIVGHEEIQYGWCEYLPDRNGQHVSMIYGHPGVVGMCSPDKFKHDIEQGRGKIVKIKITVVEEMVDV